MKKKLLSLTMCGILLLSSTTYFVTVVDAESSEEAIIEYTVDEFNEIFRKIYNEWKKEASYYTAEEEDKKIFLLKELSDKYGLEVGKRLKIRGLLQAKFSSFLYMVGNDYNFEESERDELGYEIRFQNVSSKFLLVKQGDPMLVEATYDPIISRNHIIAFTDAELISPSDNTLTFFNTIDMYVNSTTKPDVASGTVKEIIPVSDLPEDSDAKRKANNLKLVNYYMILKGEKLETGIYVYYNEKVLPEVGNNITFSVEVFNGILYTDDWYIW